MTLQPEDDACDPRQAVAAANKLINEKATAVIGAYCSSATIPASEPLMAAKIFMITPASTSEKVTESGHKFMFRTCGRDDDQSKAAVKFMTDQLKSKNVYIVDDKTTYSQGLAVPQLTPQESLLLQLAEEHLKHLLPARLMQSMDGFFNQARRNLGDSHDQRCDTAALEREWPRKVRVVATSQPLLPPAIAPGWRVA